MTSLFLSHSSKDKAAAESLKEWLRARGHSVFLDFDPESGIKGGADWEQTLYRRLRVCRVVIPLLTPDWLASKWCFAEVVHARSNGKVIVPLKFADCDASSVFPNVQQVDLIRDSDEGYRRLEIALQEVFPWDPQRPPYPGLLAFQEDDAAIFFGRTPEIAAGIETLESQRRRGPAAPRFALVLGASGSGKSSLVRAGILPRLRVRDGWLPVPPLRPRDDPLGELAASLTRAYEQAKRPRDYVEIHDRLEAALAGKPPDGNALIGIARDLAIKVRGGDDTVLIVVDQAEELFGESGTQQADRFLRLLRASLERADGRLIVLAILRSEFLGAFQTHPFLLDPAYPEPFAYEEITVDPVPVDRFGEIIRGPAELAGIGLADELVERMVTDTGTRDALPLLAYTLRRLWDSEVYRADGHFDLDEYAALGGLEGSICRAADEAFGAHELQSDQLDALRATFVPSLVRVGADGARVRRRAYRDELPRSAEKPITRFIDARLLVTDRDRDGRETIELAHEALLRVWPQLDAWLEQDQDKLRLFESVLGAAEEWQRGDRGADLLVHRGDRLAEALALAREPRFSPKPGTVAADYLSVCDATQRAREAAEREERERRVRDAERIAAGQRKVARRTIAVLLAVLVLAIGIALAAWVARNKANEAEMQRVDAEQARVRAEEARTRAEKQARMALARQLAAQAQAVVEWYPQRALLLAVEALRRPLEMDGVRLPGPETALRDLLATVGGVPVIGPLEQEHLRYLKSGERDYGRNLLLASEGRWLAVRAKDRTSYDVFSLTDTMVPPLRIRVPSNLKVYPAFDPQGRWLAINGKDGVVTLWDLPSTKKDKAEPFVEITGNKAGIANLAFDKEGHYLAAATYDGYVLLWDTSDLKRDPQRLRAWEKSVERLAFDSRGRWLAAISKGKVGVWDLTDLAAAPIVLPARLYISYDLAIGPEGRWVAAGDAGYAAYLWDLTKPTVDPITVKLDVRQYVKRVAFDPLGRWLAILPTGNNVRLVKLADPAAPLVVPKAAGRRSYSSRMLAIDPKGRWLATGDAAVTAGWDRAEGHIRLWDLSKPTLPPRVLRGHEQRVLAAAFSADARWLTTLGADRVVRRWDLTRYGAAPVVLHGHEGWIMSVALDPMGRWLASGHRQGAAQLSDLTDPGTAARQLHGQRGEVGVSFDPKGRWLATADKDRILRLWDIRDPEASRMPMIELRGHDQETVTISRFGFDPTGRWLVAGSEKKKTVLLWNLETPKGAPLVLRGHEEQVETLAFDLAGQWLATGSGDGSARLWSLENPGAKPRVLRGLGGGVRRIAFDPEGTWIRVIFSSGAKKILEWDLVNPAALPRAPQPYERIAQAEKIIAFDSHWRWLVTKNQDPGLEYRLWESANPDRPALLLEGPGRFLSLSFGPQGRWLATGGIDGTARLWPLANPQAGQVVLRGHERQVWKLAFDASGRWLATASMDGTARLWDLRIENLLDLACQIAGRNLSAEEWDQYLGGLEYRATCPDAFSGAKAEGSHGER